MGVSGIIVSGNAHKLEMLTNCPHNSIYVLTYHSSSLCASQRVSSATIQLFCVGLISILQKCQVIRIIERGQKCRRKVVVCVGNESLLT